MGLRLITLAATEPVTVVEAKAHLRVEAATDDMLISSLIKAAVEYVENFTRRALLTSTWELSLDSWTEVFLLPKAPLQSVTSLTYKDSSGTLHTLLEDTNYHVDITSEPGRIVPVTNWPTDALHPVGAITIRFIAGYPTASTVPQTFKQAILLLVGHWYENREAAVVGTIATKVPFAVEALLWPQRVMRWF